MKIKKYAFLIRAHTLDGMWLCFFPALFVIGLLGNDLFAALWIPFFLFGAFLIRSAGCIINDIADRNFDKKVERTTARPIASGEISVTEGIQLLILFLGAGASLLFFLPPEAIPIAVLTAMGMSAYPLAKRYFSCPQLLLSVVFNVGALFASIATVHFLHGSAFFVYLACFAWTLYYDTIYGHQDKRDDAALGLHSLALTKFGSKSWLKKYARIALSFLAFAGVLPGLNLLYYAGLAALFFASEKYTESIDLDNPESCAEAFKLMSFVGLFIFLLILLGRI